MMLSNPKRIGLGLLCALALTLAASASARAEAVQLHNTTNVQVYYDYSMDGGRSWMPTSLAPVGQAGDYQDYYPVGFPMQIRYWRGAGFVNGRQLPYIAGRPVTQYQFVPFAGGGVELRP